MGISTFAHVITDEEASVLKATPDSIINKLACTLCERPIIRIPGEDDDAGGGSEVKKVSIPAKLYEFLAPPPAGSAKGDKEEGLGNEVYLEQGTKFWSASVSGMFVSVKFGKKGTDGQSNSHSGPDAREYFEDKVHEKLRKGYKRKDPDASKKGAAVSALKKLAKVSEGGGAATPEPGPEEEAVPSRRSKRKAAGGADDA
eukprot:CAMPEP_0206244052 /NCGR_PEP_ID=MMETSP0047_2-20121206/17943_1 /ASSEMBLY_ACC=CAM_ASM_000192 /TAXON_ID=195065 /ORGANISM="Chroomonas mesostigmatica_cf, Strain CCMP1168" /LENGTH=199 /DNA_ID=CAMNT_0053669229 /DNA_START=72 /DNA_END=668 /DNA_ORIENTATION=+